MQFDAALLSYNLAELPALTRSAEATGFDGLWLAETTNDPFLGLTLVAEHSRTLTVGSGIAVAFPRSPGTLAYIGWNLAKFARGRLVIGLGTQVRAHNELRFGVKWEKPVRKMRETILAMRAFWDAWQNDKPLRFHGEFFRLGLMTPFFNPGPHEYPNIPIYIAAVNEQMLRLAGEICDGVVVHSYNTPRYLREYALPHIESGLAKTGRSRSDLTLISSLFVIPTDDPAARARIEADVRQQIAFYMSTPSYRSISTLHGWDEIAAQLSKLARSGEWTQMAHLITDDILDEMALTGTWAELPGKIQARYGGLLDRVSYYLPYRPGQDDVGWRATVDGFKALRT